MTGEPVKPRDEQHGPTPPALETARALPVSENTIVGDKLHHACRF